MTAWGLSNHQNPSFRRTAVREGFAAVWPESMQGAVEGFGSVAMGGKGLFHWRAILLGGHFQ
jgi:hypothetical protein